MSFINKFLEAFGNCNCIPNMIWSKITTDITEEEKQEFLKWLDDNDLGLSPQERVEGIMLINKTTLKFLLIKDIRNLSIPNPFNQSETIKKEIVKKECTNINTITCNKFDYDQPCGWLSPQGVLIECDWGDHESKAYEIVCDLDKREELEQFEKEYYSDYSRDFLVEILGYILLDCPAHDGHLSITFPTRTSKAQRIYLENYLTKIKDYDTLEEFIG